MNDAFGTAHRAHATTAGIVPLLPRRAAGDLMLSELEHLRVVREPARPLLCLLGGAKVSDKLAVLEALAPHADVLAIGGAMAYTFLRCAGEPVGSSLVEEDRLEDAARVVAAARAAGRRLLLPVDHVVAERMDAAAPTRVVDAHPRRLDGARHRPAARPRSTPRRPRAPGRSSGTARWACSSSSAFAKGTEAVARAVADSAAISVVGGGDSLAAVAKVGVADRITHLSTGGGASLEFVQGLALPGVAALEDAECGARSSRPTGRCTRRRRRPSPSRRPSRRSSRTRAASTS